MVHVPRSKTALTQLPPEFVARRALYEILDRGLDRPLTLVCAPPGFGKTVLLTDWVRRCGVPTAWLTLDEEDDDPHRLWSGVLAALEACPGVPVSSRLRRLAVSRTPVLPDFLDDLLAGLDALPVPLQLVLDGAHHLRNHDVLHGLQMLVRAATASGLRLVLACRADPGLPVARLRLEERLCELRTEQLRFSPDESAVLLARCGLRLRASQVAVLHARTGGWAAGLRLAALPLRRHPEPDVFLSAFSGDEQPVAGYLVGEVLSQMCEDERRLLRQTSISDVLPAALAIDLSGREDAPDVLDRLEHRTGLVVTTGAGRAEYRTEDLLRSYLVADLDRHCPGRAARLHGRAAEWWADRNRPLEALRHAVAAGEPARVTRLLHGCAADLAARGEHAALHLALDAVSDPGADRGSDPWSGLVRALLHLDRGDRAAARVELRRCSPAGSYRAADPSAVDPAVLLTAAERLAGIGIAPTEEEPVPEDPAAAAWAHTGRGVAHLATGGIAVGRRELEAALELAADRHLRHLEVLCLTLLGGAAWAMGDLRAAEDHARDATARDATPASWTAAAQAVRAHAALLRARPAIALQAAADGLRAAPDGIDPAVRFALHSAHGGGLVDTGDRTAGLMELQHARAELGDGDVPVPLAAAAALLEHHTALALGHPMAAVTTAAWLGARGAADGELAVMRAWTDASCGQGRYRAARAAVDPLLGGSLCPVLPHTVVEAWLLAARVALADDDRGAVRHAVQRALALAEPLDALRPFAHAGPGVRAVLVDQLGGMEDRTDFAVRALAAGRPATPHPVVELSAREREVLARLPSLHNLDEIADDLDVSLNTIKSHVRAIYGKLGVSSRRTAVLTAHEHGLLT
jgi:LuxR family maltose regulon positive regulatory protein